MRRMRDESGAMMVFLALLICFVLIPLAAIALDLGVQRVARRDMQSLADVVALDLSRDVDGSRSASTILEAWDCPIKADGSCAAAADNRPGRSVSRNNTTLGEPATVTAQLGCLDGEVFRAVDTQCVNPDAVKVDSGTAVKFNLMAGEGEAHRTAYGASKQTACYFLGSFAARFSTNDSTLLQQNGGALNDLLGVDLDIVSYQGLAAADVTLAELAATSQIGGVDQLLGGEITLGDLISATYAVLNTQGEPENSVALNLLNNPAAWLGTDLDAVVDLGKLVGVSTMDSAALDSYVNVLDLVAGSIAVANGQNLVSLDGLGLLGVVDATKSYVKVIQGKVGPICGKPDDPRPGVGEGESSQIDVHLEGNLANLGLGTAGIGVTTASGSYVVNAKVGRSQAKLVGDDGSMYPSVHCGSSSTVDPDKMNVRVTNSLAQADVGVNVHLEGTTASAASVVSVPLVTNLVNGLLSLLKVDKILKVTYNIDVSFSGATNTPPPTGIAHLQVPQNSLGNEKATPPLPDGVPVSMASSSALQLPTLGGPTVTGSITVTSSLLSLLGIPVGQRNDTIAIDLSKLPTVQPLVNAVTNAVNNNAALDTITDGVNDALADLGKVLGISLGGVDVFADYHPTCNGAELFG